ncbi:putative Succinylglutamate desuccinylase / Aspartoacylase family protein [Paratrimastix pyriformis]|uniref:Succinylglutamate desuccinylase / Aspartoacylase family protein n=1 Tax=Paratrimastix pyriformis TaxID=342808 RepID=A0ABQ8UKW6_9EUKA|nr:putative Succinylglutamate desuccinylase / Aspartoacylase family protein [Paratrimastix pyriformis]|eukprot:GAFH01003062.1.p2 GENE.GAFH01003062.1~~GAFH01003062.1.p2  ORF type:complete len:330 (-),score=96.29 GAFH01003062.1:24-983(-)
MPQFYPIGSAGQPWGAAEKLAWLACQKEQRSYHDDVLVAIEDLRALWDVEQYATITGPAYGGKSYPMMVLRSRPWNDDLPIMLVTGGVHGYETSGVHGALKFAREHATEYVGRANIMVVPCVSAWAYERIHRWNPEAIDPNRNFVADSTAQESAALVRLVAPIRGRVLMHIDLHETTDTDESEFGPAKAARDGAPTYERGVIPDGFYVVGDTENPQGLPFQQAIIEAVRAVTHIAPDDGAGKIIGSPVVAPGVINYPLRELALCAGVTGARYASTTEVYPDSPKVTNELCNQAQVAAVRAAIAYALAHPVPPAPAPAHQ